MSRKNIVSAIAAKMREIAPFSKTILFGSEARGEANKNSDIDLLILVPDDYEKNFNKLRGQIADELYMIEMESEVQISPIILLQKMWNERRTPLTCNVEQDGITL